QDGQEKQRGGGKHEEAHGTRLSKGSSHVSLIGGQVRVQVSVQKCHTPLAAKGAALSARCTAKWGFLGSPPLLALGAAEVLPPSLLPCFLQHLLPRGPEPAHAAVAIRHWCQAAHGPPSVLLLPLEC